MEGEKFDPGPTNRQMPGEAILFGPRCGPVGKDSVDSTLAGRVGRVDFMFACGVCSGYSRSVNRHGETIGEWSSWNCVVHSLAVGLVPLWEYQTNGFFFAAVAVPSGIGIDTGIAVFRCGFFGKAILLADGFSHPLPNPDIDPLTVPPPVFRLTIIHNLPLAPRE